MTYLTCRFNNCFSFSSGFTRSLIRVYTHKLQTQCFMFSILIRSFKYCTVNPKQFTQDQSCKKKEY